jgi:drug/metabolite transporter (DMT)-like permease
MNRTDPPTAPSATPKGDPRPRFRAWLSQPPTRRSNLAGVSTGLLWGVIWTLWLLSQRNAAPEPSVMGSVLLLIPIALFVVCMASPPRRAGRVIGWYFFGGAVLGAVRILGYF